MKSKIQILLLTLSLFLFVGTAMAQVPQLFNYQGIARDAKGNPLSNQKMALKISVLPTSDATVAEYEETQLVSTNEFGLYTLQIGNGQAINGEMKTVKWETGNKYIKVAIDPTGGTNYVDAGTNQLLSVPYAIYADKAGVAANGGTDKTRAGTVSTSGAGTGTVNYLTKFTAANTIYNSQIFDNGTSIGIGTAAPSALSKLHMLTTVGNIEHIRMQNTNASGFGKFMMYNDVASNYATFTKYGSTFPSGYPGIASMYPYANMLAFGNNLGPFLLANNGNVGIGIVTGGTTKLYFNAQQNTGYLGIGGSALPSSNVHFSNSTAGDTLKITNSTTGHLKTDGLEIRNTGNAATIMNRENSSLSFGTNNNTAVNITAGGNTEVNGQIKIAGGAPGVGKLLVSDATGLASWSTTASAGLVSGSGTVNSIPKFTPNGTTLGNSNITDNGTEISMGLNSWIGSTLNLGGPVGVDTPSISFSYQGGNQLGTMFLNSSGQLQFTPNNSNPGSGSPTFTLDDDGGGASFAEGVFIQGNTGIGINATHKLHVKSASTNSNPLVVTNSANSNPLVVVNEGGAGNGYIGVYDVAGTEGGRLSGSDGRSWMSGRVGVGTTNPVSKLHVIGEADSDTTIYASTSNGASSQLIAVYGNQSTSGFGAGVVGRGFGGTVPASLPDVGVYGSAGTLGVWSAGTLRVSGSNEAVGRTLTCTSASGNATWSEGVGFAAHGSGNVAASATSLRVYPTEEYDNGNGYNPATGIFTAPVAGLYHFTFSEGYNQHPNTSQLHVSFVVNGVFPTGSHCNPSTSDFWGASYSRDFHLSAGDQVQVRIFNSGVAVCTSASPIRNSFSGHLIR